MAKFIITITRVEQITHDMEVEVTITREQIVDEFELTGEDRQEWRDYAETYITAGYLEELIEEGKVLSDTSSDPEFDDGYLQSVEEI